MGGQRKLISVTKLQSNHFTLPAAGPTDQWVAATSKQPFGLLHHVHNSFTYHVYLFRHGFLTRNWELPNLDVSKLQG
jgi:hypothetical protein